MLNFDTGSLSKLVNLILIGLEGENILKERKAKMGYESAAYFEMDRVVQEMKKRGKKDPIEAAERFIHQQCEKHGSPFSKIPAGEKKVPEKWN